MLPDPHSRLNPGSDQPECPPPDAASVVRGQIDAITTGLPEQQVRGRETAVLGFLARNEQAVGPGAAQELLSLLQGRVAACGLTPATVAGSPSPPSDPGPAGPAGGPAGSEGEFFVVRGDEPGLPPDPSAFGTYRRTARGVSRVANFVMTIDRDHTVHDAHDVSREFAGTINLDGEAHPIRVSHETYAGNEPLLKAIYAAAGPRAVVSTRMDVFRQAVSSLSRPLPVRTSRKFGWDAGGTAFVSPGCVITAAGILPPGAGGTPVVDLSGTEKARVLGLCHLEADALGRAKRHVAAELLRLHPSRRVMFALLGAIAVPILQPFAPQTDGRFAFWLVGPSGAGKTALARLITCFYGRFQPREATTSWNSTPNYLEREGYWFGDSLYLIDDYKPSLVHANAALRILQNYADGSARGRLNADATSNVTRPIRGQVLITAEDTLDASASGSARSVVVRVPHPDRRDPVLLRECGRQSVHYPAVTADFIAYCLRERFTEGFADRMGGWQARFLERVRGQPNEARIAANYGVLAASLEVIGRYFGDVWPEASREVTSFLDADLGAMIEEAVRASGHEREGQILVRELGGLVANRAVRIDGYRPRSSAWFQGDDRNSAPVVGRASRYDPDVLWLNMSLCVEQVNRTLTAQHRAPIKQSHTALLGQLRQDGLLVDVEGHTLSPTAGGENTFGQRVDGVPLRCFGIRASVLVAGEGDEMTAPSTAPPRLVIPPGQVSERAASQRPSAGPVDGATAQLPPAPGSS